MAKRSQTPSADEDLRDLEQIAADLYAARPDGFVAARDEHVKKARAEGRQALARELSQVARPTQSAWLVNLLWRDQREVLDQLMELGDQLRRAQADASPEDLRRLAGVRRDLEQALVQRAHKLGKAASVTVSASVEREIADTLSAALADPAVAAGVRTGRLVKPAEYAGFGQVPLVAPSGHPDRIVPRTVKKEPPSRASSPAPGPSASERAADQRAKQERKDAERRVADAQAELGKTESALAERRAVFESAQHRHHELRGQLDELRDSLRQLERDTERAERAAEEAARERDEANERRESAARLLKEAEKNLEKMLG